ncbi:MAG: YvcK family protein [Gloeomargarita sp. SKYB31]|nr:YvcK family protein [Gloeomargarita sp. SKYB31]
MGKHASLRFRQWLKWLRPGLFVKRWLLLTFVGTVLVVLGLSISLRLTPINSLLQLIESVVRGLATVIPSHISGPLAILLGLGLIIWSQTRSVGTLTEALRPEGEQDIVDVLIAQRQRNRGPKIVALGGGTGLSRLLRGLKHYSSNITAIVTVADDGGSSGRLRREVGVLPPGDIRNCLAALASEEQLLTALFQYRFEAGEGLSGHSFGNLYLTALTHITGSLEQAIAASSRVLAVRGQVLPATMADVHLWAELADGRRVEGESQIPKAKGRIVRIGCTPAHPPALPKAIEAIEDADLILVGPGSLYTSVIPNLLVPAITEAIARATVPRVYICNAMTEPGETQGYRVSDHLRAIEQVTGGRIFDVVLVQKKPPSPQALQRYAQVGSEFVELDREQVIRMGYRLLLADVIQEDPQKGYVQHHPQRLAHVLMRWYQRVHGWW